MEENAIIKSMKNLNFEKSGETLTVCITLENVSLNKKTNIISFLDQLYQEAKEAICSTSQQVQKN